LAESYDRATKAQVDAEIEKQRQQSLENAAKPNATKPDEQNVPPEQVEPGKEEAAPAADGAGEGKSEVEMPAKDSVCRRWAGKKMLPVSKTSCRRGKWTLCK